MNLKSVNGPRHNTTVKEKATKEKKEKQETPVDKSETHASKKQIQNGTNSLKNSPNQESSQKKKRILKGMQKLLLFSRFYLTKNKK